jgi:hypothetical protein
MPNIDTLRHELEIARVPDANGWPEPGGPYWQLMDAEATAAGISWLNLDGPGLFRPVNYLKIYYNNPDRRHLLQMQHIFAARRRLVEARVAAGVLQHRTIMPDNVLEIIGRRAPRLVQPIAARIVAAAGSDFEVYMVKRDTIQAALGDVAVNQFLNGTEWVYTEYGHGHTPHETIDGSRQAVAAVSAAHEELIANALPREQMLERLALGS